MSLPECLYGSDTWKGLASLVHSLPISYTSFTVITTSGVTLNMKMPECSDTQFQVEGNGYKSWYKDSFTHLKAELNDRQLTECT